MDRHMKVVYDLLALEVNKEVRTIGIWGSSIRVSQRKTTFARYIYSEMFVNFQTYVFLDNVENMKDKLLKFEGEEDPTVIISSYHDGHEITEARRKHRKVLLIADDVNNIEQGKWIIEYANWFAPGSRIILISQNKNMLVDAGVKHVYEVTSFRLLGSFLYGRGRDEWVATLLKLKAKQGGNIMEV
ncbi:hypothetical protein ARALYDRAFT_916327 [Arabidopsis lyrata subsp. lyrata]|uniref:NB-ARC domain-containing protein n=1 Tax=Arabidopsis lyrata subsp. lyrata TaxID=81972 RepID=D7MJI7_ARALL|nr:hypothetical protein ARALYDRAFT_916327 [Arabidopsis lyrata subsp. lyrata]